LPSDLEAVVLRCLEKDPRMRFQTVAELAFALEGYAAEEGPARGILHVMETAQKVEIPTIMTDASTYDEGRGRTIGAFSSGAQTARNSRPPWVLIGIASGLFAVVSLVAAMAITGKLAKRPPAAAATQVVPSTSEVSPVPVPSPLTTTAGTADPAPVGTVIGASDPNAAPVAPMAPAGATNHPAAKPTGLTRTGPVAGGTKPTAPPKPTIVPPPPAKTAPPATTPTAPPAPKPTNATDPGNRF